MGQGISAVGSHGANRSPQVGGAERSVGQTRQFRLAVTGLDQDGCAAQQEGRLNVPNPVPDVERFGEVQLQVGLGPAIKPKPGLSAITWPRDLGVMGTVVHAIEFNVVGREELLEPLLYRREVVLSKEPARYAGLISDDHERVTEAAQFGQRIHRTGNQFHQRRIAEVIALDDKRAVPVKKSCRPPVCGHRSGGRRGIPMVSRRTRLLSGRVRPRVVSAAGRGRVVKVAAPPPFGSPVMLRTLVSSTR